MRHRYYVAGRIADLRGRVFGIMTKRQERINPKALVPPSTPMADGPSLAGVLIVDPSHCLGRWYGKRQTFEQRRVWGTVFHLLHNSETGLSAAMGTNRIVWLYQSSLEARSLPYFDRRLLSGFQLKFRPGRWKLQTEISRSRTNSKRRISLKAGKLVELVTKRYVCLNASTWSVG